MVMTRPPSPRRAKPTDTLDPGGGSETCRGWNRSEGESASTDAVPFSPETVNSHAGKRMVPCAVSQMSVPRCTRRTLSDGPAYIPCAGGVGVARKWNACRAEMMTQRPSRAGDEGNLKGGLTRPKPKAIFASPLTKQRRSTGLLELPDWEGWNPQRQPTLCLLRPALAFPEKKGWRFRLRHRCPWWSLGQPSGCWCTRRASVSGPDRKSTRLNSSHLGIS